MTEVEVARAAAISFNEYWDIEHYPKEAEDVASLRQIKGVCAALGLDLLDLFEIECAFCTSAQQASEDHRPLRSELIRRQRMILALSERALAERLECKEWVIKGMETDPGFLEAWSVELIRGWLRS